MNIKEQYLANEEMIREIEKKNKELLKQFKYAVAVNNSRFTTNDENFLVVDIDRGEWGVDVTYYSDDIQEIYKFCLREHILVLAINGEETEIYGELCKDEDDLPYRNVDETGFNVQEAISSLADVKKIDNEQLEKFIDLLVAREFHLVEELLKSI